jgi:hypothetical protein
LTKHPSQRYFAQNQVLDEAKHYRQIFISSPGKMTKKKKGE